MSVAAIPPEIGLMHRLLARGGSDSYWQVLYRDGRIVSEGAVDWSLLPRTGLVAARLYCPDGSVGDITHLQAGERVFQLKAGRLSMAIAVDGSAPATSGRHRDAQILGVVTSTDGDCRCYAWEAPINGEQRVTHPDGTIETRRFRRPGRLIEFTDNIHQMRYLNIGRLNLGVLGVSE
jgi:hypothetical protein